MSGSSIKIIEVFIVRTHVAYLPNAQNCALELVQYYLKYKKLNIFTTVMLNCFRFQIKISNYNKLLYYHYLSKHFSILFYKIKCSLFLLSILSQIKKGIHLIII